MNTVRILVTAILANQVLAYDFSHTTTLSPDSWKRQGESRPRGRVVRFTTPETTPEESSDSDESVAALGQILNQIEGPLHEICRIHVAMSRCLEILHSLLDPLSIEESPECCNDCSSTDQQGHRRTCKCSDKSQCKKSQNKTQPDEESTPKPGNPPRGGGDACYVSSARFRRDPTGKKPNCPKFWARKNLFGSRYGPNSAIKKDNRNYWAKRRYGLRSAQGEGQKSASKENRHSLYFLENGTWEKVSSL